MLEASLTFSYKGIQCTSNYTIGSVYLSHIRSEHTPLLASSRLGITN